MRKLLTTAFASLALATAFVGTASASGDIYFDDTPNLNNPALKDQIDRDATEHRPLHQAPLGALVSPGDEREPANSVAIDNGEVDHQSARMPDDGATDTKD